MLQQIMNSPTMDYMQRGLAAANLRQEVISNNIANVNTPKFKRSDVIFESLLAKELGLVISGGTDYHGANKPHIAIGKGKGNLEIPYSVLDGLRKRHQEIFG